MHYAWAIQQVMIPGEMKEFNVHRHWKLKRYAGIRQSGSNLG
jgi:hypothetical protein